GVLVFIIFETILLRIDPLVNAMLSLQGYSWLLLLLGFMGVTWLAQNMAYRNSDKSMQYGGYLLYILAEAIIFVPILYIAMYYGGGPQMIMLPSVITGRMFIVLSAAVMLTSTYFSFLRTGLTVGFFIALGLIAAGTIF